MEPIHPTVSTLDKHRAGPSRGAFQPMMPHNAFPFDNRTCSLEQHCSPCWEREKPEKGEVMKGEEGRQTSTQHCFLNFSHFCAVKDCRPAYLQLVEMDSEAVRHIGREKIKTTLSSNKPQNKQDAWWPISERTDEASGLMPTAGLYFL